MIVIVTTLKVTYLHILKKKRHVFRLIKRMTFKTHKSALFLPSPISHKLIQNTFTFVMKILQMFTNFF